MFLDAMIILIVIFFHHSKYILPCSPLCRNVVTSFSIFLGFGSLTCFGIICNIVLILALYFWYVDVKCQEKFWCLLQRQKLKENQQEEWMIVLQMYSRSVLHLHFFENCYYYWNYVSLYFFSYYIVICVRVSLWGDIMTTASLIKENI